MPFDTKARDKYNKTTYARYTIRVNKEKDDMLYEYIQEYMKAGRSLNELVLNLLREEFSRRWFNENN